jgi:glycosyltransferase involved in cell wall biosynthesis
MFTEWSWRRHAWMKQPFWHLGQRSALDRVHCFHATAADEFEDVRRRGFRQPVAVIPNGIDVPPDVDRHEKTNRIVFLSRIDPKKGLELLFEAWSSLAQDFRDWELVIAGPLDSTYADKMQNLVRERAIPRTTFSGAVYGARKTELLAGSRLFVLPTYSENFGLAIADALAHGTPVITTIETPWKDLSERGCGWSIRPDARELKEAMTRALSTPALELSAMGAIGRAWMARDYGWDGVAERMTEVYRWLIDGGAKPECVAV